MLSRSPGDSDLHSLSTSESAEACGRQGLRQEDHYLLMMVNQAGGAGVRDTRWRAVAVLLAIAGVCVLLAIGLSSYLGRDIGRDELVFFLWAAAASSAVAIRA